MEITITIDYYAGDGRHISYSKSIRNSKKIKSVTKALDFIWNYVGFISDIYINVWIDNVNYTWTPMFGDLNYKKFLNQFA